MDEGLAVAIYKASFAGRPFQPVLGKSERYNGRRIYDDDRTCEPCIDKEGTIYPLLDNFFASLWQLKKMRMESHSFCRCWLDVLNTIQAGTATSDGVGGADWAVKYTGRLPEPYILKEEAKRQGWDKKKGNLWDVLPGKSLFTVFYNDKKKLPDAPGRYWYEADIHYTGGYRNTQRLLFSNDGLVLATYNHYRTFYEIVS